MGAGQKGSGFLKQPVPTLRASSHRRCAPRPWRAEVRTLLGEEEGKGAPFLPTPRSSGFAEFWPIMELMLIKPRLLAQQLSLQMRTIWENAGIWSLTAMDL